MHRLVAYAHNGVQRFVVDRPEMLIGSGEGCDIRLPFAGVGTEHARLRAERGRLAIEDLGSRKGVVVNGERQKQADLEVLDEIRLGSIALLVEDVTPEAPEAPAAEDLSPAVPVRGVDAEGFLGHLAGIARWVLSDTVSSRTLESHVTAVLGDFGGGVVYLFQGELDQPSIKFVVATEARWLVSGEALLQQVRTVLPAGGPSEAGEVASIEGSLDGQSSWIAFQTFRALEKPYLFVVALPAFEPGEWDPTPAFEAFGDLLSLGLIHHVGRFQPIVFSTPDAAELTLAPGLVVGESKPMKRVLTDLRAAVDPPVHVLLRGEPGVSKELLARSLHLSGPQREGAFVAASCAGVDEQQLGADLFGAEIPGRDGPVVREGKLLAADGGTLFLEDVEQLPLRLQDRLVRFLRAGEVEPIGSLDARRVGVRLIASSNEPLEPIVARDQFRIDLAYRLSQLAIDVPSLRQRREDLPLLIQATINRCCHQTGKRVQGITVKALGALAVYDYPGNLPELENIIRRLVYLCPEGRPIDESMLSEEVRLAKVEGLHPEVDGDLRLDRLVANCERAAIREALRRSDGNRSAAARLLGLSRNGLAMKAKRLGLTS